MTPRNPAREYTRSHCFSPEMAIDALLYRTVQKVTSQQKKDTRIEPVVTNVVFSEDI